MMRMLLQRMNEGDASDNDERPDGHIITPRDNIITDVVIANPLCPTHTGSASLTPLATAKKGEAYKTHKYARLANNHHAKFIPFSAIQQQVV